MLLTRLSLQNVGPFAGEHTLDLEPPSDDRPIVLIGGMNGCGKTTILEAVLLTLYGKLSPAVRETGVGYDEYLRRLLNRGHARDGASIELDFRSRQDGANALYRVTRAWSVRGNSIRDRVDVQIDGHYDPVLSEHWQERVESFLPVRLSKLFFFDGERIESLADPRRAPDMISAAIHALLGIDIVVQLEADLTLLDRRKVKEQQDERGAEAIGTLEDELDSLQSQRGDLKQRIASLVDPLRRAEIDLERLEEQFRRDGGEAAARRDLYEDERLRIEASLAEVRKQMIGIAGGPLPLLLVRGQLRDVLAQAARERDAAQADAMAKVLEARDDRILSALRDMEVPAKAIRKIRSLLNRDRADRVAGVRFDRRLELNPATVDHIQRLLEHVLDEQRAVALQLLERHDGLMDRSVEVQRALAASPDEEAIRPLAEALERQRTEVADRHREQARLEGERDALDQRIATATRELEKRLEARRSVEIANADVKRFLSHCGRARSTLETFRTRLIEQHVRRLEGLVLEGFVRLLRKERMVSRIRIDPKSCELTLFDAAGKEWAMERLSAGERQLLATSILWGLARAARRPLPVVIDTPLGRLDSEHRRHFVDEYLPWASHQALVLSTDEEIDEAHLERLHRRIGRSYRLDHDDERGCTTISEGYFWEEPTHAT